MIIDNIKNAATYYKLGKNIKKALKYLQGSDFTSMQPGKYEIDGIDVYALVQEYETKLSCECQWEAHKKYIDIQYVAKGSEQIGYAYINNLNLKKEYDQEKDYLLLRGSGDFFRCNAGTFVILNDEDAHMPGVTADNQLRVKKVIVKVLKL